jgi:hypothetical protein
MSTAFAAYVILFVLLPASIFRWGNFLRTMRYFAH